MAKVRGIEGKVSPIYFGNMYLYWYVPTDQRSGYFDLFPLVMVTKVVGSSFEGINFHYVQMKRRIQLFNLLKPFFTDETLTEESRFDAKSFRKKIFNMYKFRDAKVSYRKYLKKGIGGSVVKISPLKWKETISTSNVEKFLRIDRGKQNPATVWKESLARSRN